MSASNNLPATLVPMCLDYRLCTEPVAAAVTGRRAHLLPLSCVGCSIPTLSFSFSSMHGHCRRHTGPSASLGNPGPVTALTYAHHPLNFTVPFHRHPSSLRTAILASFVGENSSPPLPAKEASHAKLAELGPGFVPFGMWRPCAPHWGPCHLPWNVFQHCLP